MALQKNLTSTLELNGLAERTEYEVHCWLANADFSAGSYISKISFTTVDCTPPIFLDLPKAGVTQLNSVYLTCTVNEDATLYWAAVRTGTEFPRPPTGGGAVTPAEAARQIIYGSGAASQGRVSTRANQSITFMVNGLRPETTYDIWYLAQDAAGNNSFYVDGDGNHCMVTATTLDNVAPTASQEFTHAPDGSENSPYADTDIRIVFSEQVRRESTGEMLTTLYETAASEGTQAAREALAEALRRTVRLYDAADDNLALERTADAAPDGWVVDYRNAVVTLEERKTVVIFPTASSSEDSALSLRSGASYYFRLTDLCDISENLNPIAAGTRLDTFTVQPPRAALQALSLRASDFPAGVDTVDMAFSVTPSSTARADADACWDLLFWPDAVCSYEVYLRSRNTSGSGGSAWRKAENPNGGGGTAYSIAADPLSAQSLYLHLYNLRQEELPALTRLREDQVYEFAIHFLSLNGDSDRSRWSQEVHMHLSVIAGAFSDLGNLSANLTQARFAAVQEEGAVTDISDPGALAFRLTRTFTDTQVPRFASGRPTFRAADASVVMNFLLNRAATVSYLLAPADSAVPARDENGLAVDWDDVPSSGSEDALTLSEPSPLAIIGGVYSGDGMASGSVSAGTASTFVTARGLLPQTNYLAYLVVRGSNQTYSQVLLYRFATTEMVPASLDLSVENPAVIITASQDVTLDYAVVSYENMSALFSRAFWNNTPSGNQNYPALFPSYANIGSVFQAITTQVDPADGSGSGSVFDRYASAAYRNTIADFIRNAQGGSGSVIGADHGVLLTQGRAFTVDCSTFSMAVQTRYALVAVGNHALSGDTFAAAWPLTIPDTQPLRIVDVQNDLKADTAGGEFTGTVSGSVVLTFDKLLYDKGSSYSPPVRHQVDLGPVYSANRPERFVSIHNMVQNSTSQTVWIPDENEANVGVPTSYIEIRYDQAQDGTFLTFKTDLCDADGNSRQIPLTVTIRIGANHQPTVEITRAWDGRS